MERAQAELIASSRAAEEGKAVRLQATQSQEELAELEKALVESGQRGDNNKTQATCPKAGAQALTSCTC